MTFPRERHTPPSDTATDELQSLGSIVLLLREYRSGKPSRSPRLMFSEGKLREGVVASHRVDNFAVEGKCHLLLISERLSCLL